MAVARQRHARSLVVAQYQLIGSLFEEKARPDLNEYIQRGDLDWSRKAPMPYMPEVEAKVAEIEANGGKFKV